MTGSITHPPTSQAIAGEVLPALRGLALRCGRPDLADLLSAAEGRVSRPDTLLAVVGEFKQGKSSLVNCLLGNPLCPVDDDIATAVVTIVRNGDPSAVMWIEADGSHQARTFPMDALPAVVTERANPGNERRVSLVDVCLPNRFLANGLSVMDTPGVGGLSPGYARMTLAYLHTVDALLFVSDASAPLTASEVEFLRAATTICPGVAVVLSKSDLFPEWKRVLEFDRETLASEGIDAHVLPVSSTLRVEAFSRNDSELNAESGYPELLDYLAQAVLDPSRELAAQRALADARYTVTQLLASLTAEEAALAAPETTAAVVSSFEAERERLDRLRAGGSRWQTLLNDRFGDLVNDAEHRFRQQIRQLTRQADEIIESTDPADSWDELAALIRDRTADVASSVIRDLEAGADQVAQQIVDLLSEDQLALDSALGRASPLNVAALWSGGSPVVTTFGEAASTTWAGLRGAQGGVLVIGMLGGLAGLALSTGALLGVGVLFGGKQLMEERKRQLTQRRQKARNGIRQFLDDVQFEAGKGMRDVARELQRRMRDHFSDRIAASIATCSSTLQRLQQNLEADAAERDRRLAELRRDIEGLRLVQSQVAEAVK